MFALVVMYLLAAFRIGAGLWKGAADRPRRQAWPVAGVGMFGIGAVLGAFMALDAAPILVGYDDLETLSGAFLVSSFGLGFVSAAPVFAALRLREAPTPEPVGPIGERDPRTGRRVVLSGAVVLAVAGLAGAGTVIATVEPPAPPAPDFVAFEDRSGGVALGSVALEEDMHGSIVVDDDAVLDCGGHRVVGNGGSGVGIVVGDRAVVRNCLVTGFGTGVGLGGSIDAVVESVTVTESRIGFYLVGGSSGVTIRDSVATGNQIGFLLEPDVEGSRIEDSRATYNSQAGFQIQGATDCVFVGNEVDGGGAGFWLQDSSDNEFRGNTVTRTRQWFAIGVFSRSSRNLFVENVVESTGVGIAVNGGSGENRFERNRLARNAKGSHVEATAGSGNVFVENTVVDNGHVGLWNDRSDWRGDYVANVCEGNADADSVPDGLCA